MQKEQWLVDLTADSKAVWMVVLMVEKSADYLADLLAVPMVVQMAVSMVDMMEHCSAESMADCSVAWLVVPRDAMKAIAP